MASDKKFSAKIKDYLAVFLVVDFLVAGFLVVSAFLAGAAFLAAGLADFSTLTPAALASLAKLALRREAVFFSIGPFLAAISYSLWALERLAEVGLDLKVLTASLIAFLIS